jgi:endonuclease-3 related protein
MEERRFLVYDEAYMDADGRIESIYRTLLAAYGPRGWWPVTPPGGDSPEYCGGPSTPKQVFEVAVGAVLTQNTSWKNASLAISNLISEGLLDPGSMAAAGVEALAPVIRPSGYYNQKARRIHQLARHFLDPGPVSRRSLLALNGIGPETADSIMLYAFGKPYFVVDAYTRRVFTRIGLFGGSLGYEDIRALFEDNLPADPSLYQEYHALIVEHAKRSCLKRPDCGRCATRDICRHSRSASL